MWWVMANVWLSVAILHFGFLQVHSNLFANALFLEKAIWFGVIFGSVAVLLGTTLPLPVHPIETFAEGLGLSIIEVRTTAMAIWVTTYSYFRVKYFK